MIGRTVSHYKIMEELGRGGMGVVYKAQDTKPDRLVALKFLPPDMTRDPVVKERFIQEAQAASSLQHDNICTIYEINETEDGQMFIAIAYYDGETLKEKISARQLTIGEAIDIAAQIGRGLAKAHERGIVHRDIKPANIMMTSEGEVKIMDFGLAKLKGQTKLTKTGSTLGTAPYMSPEQTRGEKVDHRTDIWSLGVVLYEMITGIAPFKGDYEQAVAYSILNEEPEPPTSLRSGVPMDLERITKKSLAKKPAERYQHVDELLVDLNKVKTERAPSLPKRKSRRAVYAIIGAVILALLFGTLWMFLQNRADLAQKRKSIAVLPFHPITKSEEDQSFAEGIHDDILTQLSKISDLRVIARTSVIRYKETQKSIKEIAHELGVGTVLEGSTRRSGNTIRITAQLIASDTEEHLWSDSYDRPYSDIFALQSDVAQKIAVALQARLSQDELRSIQTQPTKNLEAYEYYKKGVFFWNVAYTGEGNIKAAEILEKACQLDTTFALAYAWQSICYSDVCHWMRRNNNIDYGLQSEKALTKAELLAPDMPEVHMARANYFSTVKQDNDAALREIEIANKKRPNDTYIMFFMSQVLRQKGDFQHSLALNEKMYQLDPKGTVTPFIASNNSFSMGQYSDAVHWADIMIANDPDGGQGYVNKIRYTLLGFGDIDRAEAILKEANKLVTREKILLLPPAYLVYLYKRDYTRALATLIGSNAPESYFERAMLLKFLNRVDEAKANFDSARIAFSDKLSATPNDGSARLFLATAYAGLGETTRALQEMIRVDSLAQRGEGLTIAYLYLLIGDNDSALRHLEKCITDPREATVFQLRLNPFLDPLRGDPRFEKVIEKADNRYK